MLGLSQSNTGLFALMQLRKGRVLLVLSILVARLPFGELPFGDVKPLSLFSVAFE